MLPDVYINLDYSTGEVGVHGCVGKYPHRIRGKKDGIGGLGKVNW